LLVGTSHSDTASFPLALLFGYIFAPVFFVAKGVGMILDLAPALQRLHSMGREFTAQLPNIAAAIIVFFLFFYASRLVRNVMRNFARRRKSHYNLGLVLGRLTQGIIVFLGLMVALVIALPSFQPSQLIQLLGISSVAIGFAFRDILQNFLSGILLLLAEPFRIGDQIRVKEFEGTVEDVQTRATSIRTYDGRRIVIPNSTLFTEEVIVNTAYQQRRLEYDVGIGYGDDIAQAKSLILEAMHEAETPLSEPAPDVLTMELADSAVHLRARWWIGPPEHADALVSRDEVLTAIKNKLTEQGIDLPFPTQVMLFHDQTEETDGDRRHQREGWPAGRDAVPRPLRMIQNRNRQAIESNHNGRNGTP
jgi:small conductance mechanosensitive channel